MVKAITLLIPIIIGVIAGAIMTLSNGEDTPRSENTLTAKSLIQYGSPILGNPSAPITILEWGIISVHFVIVFMNQA